MQTQKGFKIASQYGVETRIVADHLTALEVGEVATYSELTKAAGIDVLKHRSIIGSARRQALNEAQRVFEPVRGQGLRRLSDDEIAATGITTSKRIGRQARRGIKVVSAGDYTKMSSIARTQQALGMTLLNFIQHSTTNATAKKLEMAIPQGAKILPLADTLKHMV